MHEYQDMAIYYDLFYSKKSYEKEINFLIELLKNRKTILDVGCGTGIHMHLLETKGYLVDGMDLSPKMLDIARTRTKGKLYQGNLLDLQINKKYDAILSMFAVFNHLSTYEEFERGIKHWYEALNPGGILVIDLHNGRKNGRKESTYKDYKRIMKWDFDKEKFKEHTEITYIIEDKVIHDTHDFLIYEMDKIKKVLDKNKLNFKLYENYSFKESSDDSKNILIVIYKE